MTTKDTAGMAARDKALFDSIAGQYADKDSRASTRIARRTRLRQTLRRVAITPDSRILEVGCGAGYAARYINRPFRSYTGIDYSEELVRHASAVNGRTNVRFQPADLYTFRTDGEYDVIFMIGVLHHMPDVPGAVQACHRLLAPGGCLAVNEPQAGNPIVAALRKLRARVDPSYSDEQDAVRPTELVSTFLSAGFSDVTATHQGFASTPFAEVIIRPQLVGAPLSRAACAMDALIEKCTFRLLRKLSWNVIVSGRKQQPGENHSV